MSETDRLARRTEFIPFKPNGMNSVLPAVIPLLVGLLSCTGCGTSPPDNFESDENRIVFRDALVDDIDPPRAEVQVDHELRRVIRQDADGHVRWSTPLEGYLHRVRPPHLLHDAERAYVSHGDGVTALDMATGHVLWHTSGPNACLCLSGELLVAVQCGRSDSIEAQGRWLVARGVGNGAEVFRVELPCEGFDAEIREVASLFLVQVGEAPGGRGDARLIDREGKVRHRFDRQVVTGKLLGEDRLFLTSKDVVLVSPDDQVRWSLPFTHREWIAGGELQQIPDGHLLAFLYGRISDSGVHVIRLDPVAGKEVWQTYCGPLRTTHSKYRHRATVAIEGDRVKVTSRGSDGTFIEFLDLRTGQKVKPPRP